MERISKCHEYEVSWEQSFSPGVMGGEWRCGWCLEICKVLEIEEKVDIICPECGKNLGK